MSFNTNILKKYAKEGYNVLLSGKHGVGKTAIIKEVFGEVFGEHNVSWKYFSSSTLDPWVDFIGIPKNYTTSDGKEVFKIIPPEHFTGEEKIEAIFFDEINRADEKTLNALMELIQFKSINGRKFPHLKCIWAAENPADDDENEYSVRELDPAQKDRFQIQLKIPYTLNSSYFINKYGKETYNISNKWWRKHKSKISPRKLDDMLGGYNKGFSLRDFTHYNKGVDELQFTLNSVSDVKQMETIIKSGDVDAIKKYFTLDKIRGYEKILKSKKHIVKEFYKHMDDEIKDYIERSIGYFEVPEMDTSRFTKAQADLITTQQNKPIKQRPEFNHYHIKDIETYINNFPFTVKNTPNMDYSHTVDDIFGFEVNAQDLKTYSIEKIVNGVNTDNLINFFTVMIKMLNTMNPKMKPGSTKAYMFCKKMYGCSKFTDPTKMNKPTVKNILKNIETDNAKISNNDLKGMFQ